MEWDNRYSLIMPVRNEIDSLLVTIPFLKSNSKFIGEILVVIDNLNDSSCEISSYYPEVMVLPNKTQGVFGAIQTAVEASKFSYILVAAADEILPILQFDEMVQLLFQGKDFVSATRYSKGGKRYGGNPTGRILSHTANSILRIFYPKSFTDFTTGFKAFRVDSWERISESATGEGWSCTLKFSLNALRNNLSISEVPIISVDRVMGGLSTFRLSKWFYSYLKIIFN